MFGSIPKSATVEQLVENFRVHHDHMIESKAVQGGQWLDHAALSILVKLCDLYETQLRSTQYYCNLLNPDRKVAWAFNKAGLKLNYKIEHKSYLFSLQLKGKPGFYTIRLMFPHPSAIFMPLQPTVH